MKQALLSLLMIAACLYTAIVLRGRSLDANDFYNGVAAGVFLLVTLFHVLRLIRLVWKRP